MAPRYLSSEPFSARCLRRARTGSALALLCLLGFSVVPNSALALSFTPPYDSTEQWVYDPADSALSQDSASVVPNASSGTILASAHARNWGLPVGAAARASGLVKDSWVCPADGAYRVDAQIRLRGELSAETLGALDTIGAEGAVAVVFTQLVIKDMTTDSSFVQDYVRQAYAVAASSPILDRLSDFLGLPISEAIESSTVPVDTVVHLVSNDIDMAAGHSYHWGVLLDLKVLAVSLGLSAIADGDFSSQPGYGATVELVTVIDVSPSVSPVLGCAPSSLSSSPKCLPEIKYK